MHSVWCSLVIIFLSLISSWRLLPFQINSSSSSILTTGALLGTSAPCCCRLDFAVIRARCAGCSTILCRIVLCRVILGRLIRLLAWQMTGCVESNT